MNRPAPIIAGIVAALLLLFGAYMGSYYAMLDYAYPVAEPERSFPVYRIDNATVSAIFAPAHQLDRLIRPGYWEAQV